MKKTFLTAVLTFFTAALFAQSKTDSVAYQRQRQKINAMLAARVRKFGEYDHSLNRHTGIFGLQTKKDIRRSNDILMDIVKTDDSIYSQIKILLEFRAFQQQQAQSKSVEVESSRLGYMSTINKLRNQADHLKAEATKQQAEYDELKRNFIIAVIVASLLLLIVIRVLSKPKAKPKPAPRKRR